jgi:hypothetical protein
VASPLFLKGKKTSPPPDTRRSQDFGRRKILLVIMIPKPPFFSFPVLYFGTFRAIRPPKGSIRALFRVQFIGIFGKQDLKPTDQKIKSSIFRE